MGYLWLAIGMFTVAIVGFGIAHAVEYRASRG